MLPLLLACALTDDGPYCSQDYRVLFHDADGDGWATADEQQSACPDDPRWIERVGDCDDNDPAIFPEAPESCADGIERDCVDGNWDEAADATELYVDSDNDGFGGDAKLGCPGGDLIAEGADCDDASASVFPGADEVCDGIDNDCDSRIDDDDDGVVTDRTWHADADGDGFGDPSTEYLACAPLEGDVADATDCADDDAARNPAAPEVCDGRDNDCDDLADDEDDDTLDPEPWYLDWDRDGFGTPDDLAWACLQPGGRVADDGDCDDTDAGVHPGAVECCGGGDEDCDDNIDDDDVDVAGQQTFFRDADGDGFAGTTSVNRCVAPAGYLETSTDCDDSAAAVYPNADEICNGMDDDCDGATDDADTLARGTYTLYVDSDGDGFGAAGTAFPACSTALGSTTDDDCDDGAADVNPGASETCDAVDNDCDGDVDADDSSAAGLVTEWADTDGDGYGDPASAHTVCAGTADYAANNDDCDDADAGTSPAASELCDAVDNDCDGDVDADDTSAAGLVTEWADADGDGYGDSSSAAAVCPGDPGYATNGDDCDDGDTSLNPAAAEVCDGTDQNCDLVIDEGCADVDGDGFADGTVDKLVVDGTTVCWHEDMIGWTGTAYTVGYGFGGTDGWTTTAHPATRDGDFYCFDFSTTGSSVYRVALWSGSGSGAYTSWVYLNMYCDVYADPLCYERADGVNACFMLSGGVISAVSTAICDAT